MNDDDAELLAVVRADMQLFAERQRQQGGQANRYRIVQTYAERFPRISFQDIETVVLNAAQEAGVRF